jgi:hypothetical protein
MINREDIHVAEEFGNSRAPHQYRVTHIPTGIFVLGNTGSEENKGRLLNDLMLALEMAIPQAEKSPPAQNDVQAQLEALQQQIAQLLARQNPETYLAKPEMPTHKRRGRPPKVKAVKATDVAPVGYSVIDPAKVPPVTRTVAPPSPSYKPSNVVAVVSDKAAAKGILA